MLTINYKDKALANAKDITVTAIKSLIWGPPGSGKTKIAATFPNPHFVDLDDGMLTVRGQDINYVTITAQETTDPDFLAMCAEMPPLKKGTPYHQQSRFEKAQIAIQYYANKLTANQTLVIDSLTFYSQSAFDHIMEVEKPKDNRQVYGAAQKLISATLDILKDRPCNVVLLAHVKTNIDEHGNITTIVPQTTGNALAAVLPGHFDEVWRTEVEMDRKDPEKHVYVIHTAPMKKENAKSRLELPAKIVDPTYEKIMKLVKNK